jgi:hypothetical protein
VRRPPRFRRGDPPLKDAQMTTTDPAVDALAEWNWQPQPAAQALLNELVSHFLDNCPAAAELSRRMTADTGTRFFDWIDCLALPDAGGIRERLEATGYEPTQRDGLASNMVALHHPGALFPHVVLSDQPVMSIAVKVDSVTDFASAHTIATGSDGPGVGRTMGAPFSQLRTLCAAIDKPANAELGGETPDDPRFELWAIERRGYNGHAPGADDPDRLAKVLQHREAIIRRQRDFQAETGDYTVGGPADQKAFEHMWSILDAAIADLGRDTACELFFEGERIYWENTNRAGQIQHLRQNRLGLGWANHDHHTYRCGRENYVSTIKTFEKLGFFCRERFYAGEEAGWGAQVLEQPVCGIVIFADVDMTPEELAGDFAHDGFAQKKDDATVGLWVRLHGEAIHQAGMHHLECMFDHHALVKQLKDEAGIGTMDPFTTFPYLRQAFTEGEMKAVEPGRIEHLLREGRIDAEQAERFRTKGALHSHLENLERNDGFKGFNQQGVSDIIARTDPRRAQAVGTGG